MVIGIDMGISSTKVVALAEGKPTKAETWDGGFTEEALRKFIASFSPSDGHVERIALTGVGSRGIVGNVLGYPSVKVDEFDANAASASSICNEPEYIVVSMGSGTSFVHVSREGARHIGGSALGGGTILGLFRQLVADGDWTQLSAMAQLGSLQQIDLTVADVCKEALPGLPLDTTVTNFGKTNGEPTPSDVALGLVNMVLQNIGVMACLAGGGRGISTFVVIGRLATLPHAQEVFQRLNDLYGVHFLLAPQAAYMTAIGAAIKSGASL